MLLAGAFLALSVACGGGEAERSPGSASAADLVHIHGLDTSDEGLFVATHLGLFEVVGDEIRRVGDATHDLMGFTAAGPDDLLASGHPDLRVDRLIVDGKPPLLGLVRSSDGRTWESLSLLGEADFHSLEAAHGSVYGYDSTHQRFMVTKDRKEWETRREPLIIGDFAVSPEDPDVIVANDQSGVVLSRDGGRQWKQVSKQQLLLLEWSAEGLFGVVPSGEVVVSADSGKTWEQRGNVGGVPEAVHVSGDEMYVAVAEHGIVKSTDGGQTFEVLIDTGHQAAP